jgi:hypothetical protein
MRLQVAYGASEARPLHGSCGGCCLIAVFTSAGAPPCPSLLQKYLPNTYGVRLRDRSHEGGGGPPIGGLGLPRFRGQARSWVSGLTAFCPPLWGNHLVGREHLSVPACTFPTPSCRAAVKDGRHASGAACRNASRPLLDRREHDGMLMCSGLESHRRKVTLECDR